MAGLCEWVLNSRKVPLSCENVDCRGPNIASSRSTFQVSNSTGFYPRIQVDTTNSGAVGSGRWGAVDRDDRHLTLASRFHEAPC